MALNINGTTGISGVDGSVSAPAVTGTDSNTGITFPAADTIKFSTGGVERMSITNSGISGITAGITEADQWRLTTEYSGSATITGNLERVDSSGYGKIGTGMTQSGGIFTFPSTGVWLVQAGYEFKINQDSDRSARGYIYLTTNNSSYTHYTLPATNLYQSSASTYGTVFGQQLLDCTDTSQVKVKFGTQVVNNPTVTRGATDYNYSYFTFIRLGDT